MMHGGWLGLAFLLTLRSAELRLSRTALHARAAVGWCSDARVPSARVLSVRILWVRFVRTRVPARGLERVGEVPGEASGEWRGEWRGEARGEAIGDSAGDMRLRRRAAMDALTDWSRVGSMDDALTIEEEEEEALAIDGVDDGAGGGAVRMSRR